MNFDAYKQDAGDAGAESAEQIEAAGAEQVEAAGADVADAVGEEEPSFVAEATRQVNNTLLVVVGMVLLGGFGIYMMYLRTGPSAAMGAVGPATADAHVAVGEFLSDGGQSIGRMRQLLAGTERVVAQFKDYPNTQQVPLSDLKGNPFHYVSTHLEPSEDAQEAARKQREEARAAVLKDVQALQLQSVLKTSRGASCMINNTLCREGQVVAGFAIDRITTNAVVVKRDGFKFELRMQK